MLIYTAPAHPLSMNPQTASPPAPLVHIIDFEGAAHCGVVEYGVATVHLGSALGQVASVHTGLCAPTNTLRPADTAVHGLRTEDITRHAPFTQHWEYFANLRGTGLLCAHSAHTEDSLLRKTWPLPRLSPNWMERAHANNTQSTWGPWVDTCQLAKRAWPQLTSHKLTSLVPALKLTSALEALAAAHCPPSRGHAHCALFDALASALVLQTLWAQVPSLTHPQGLLIESAASAKAREALNQSSF